MVSGKFATVANRLITAAMLVALLIACQEMPESQNNLRDFYEERTQK